MLRTTAPGHDNNRYTEGNPSLGDPATIFSAESANFFQEEIVNVVLEAGLTLSADEDQLKDAILALIASGGGTNSQINISLDNNQTDTDVTGLLFDNSQVKAAVVEYAIQRQDDDPTTETQMGTLRLIYDSVAANWLINDTSVLDDAGVSFSVTATGQVRYTSSNFTGANYAGSLRASITKLLD